MRIAGFESVLCPEWSRKNDPKEKTERLFRITQVWRVVREWKLDQIQDLKNKDCTLKSYLK